MIKLATEAKRCIVVNATTPTDVGKLPEPDEVEMTEFIDQARLLLGALGYDIFEPAAQLDFASPTTKELTEFEYSGEGFAAKCVVDSEAGQFIVKAGSKARKSEASSLNAGYHDTRVLLVDNGVLLLEQDHYVFTQDYSFGAASAAAAAVSGQTINGRKAWKRVGTSETFAEWEDSRLGDESLETSAG